MKKNILSTLIFLSFSSCYIGQEQTALQFSDNKFSDQSTIEKKPLVVSSSEVRFMNPNLFHETLNSIFATPPTQLQTEYVNGFGKFLMEDTYIYFFDDNFKSTHEYQKFRNVGCDIYAIHPDAHQGELGFTGAQRDGWAYTYYKGADGIRAPFEIGENCQRGGSKSLHTGQNGTRGMFVRQFRIKLCEMLVTNDHNKVNHTAYQSKTSKSVKRAVSLLPFFYKYYRTNQDEFDEDFVPEFNQKNLEILTEAFYPINTNTEEAASVWLKLNDPAYESFILSTMPNPEGSQNYFFEIQKWKIAISGVCQSLAWEVL